MPTASRWRMLAPKEPAAAKRPERRWEKNMEHARQFEGPPTETAPVGLVPEGMRLGVHFGRPGNGQCVCQRSHPHDELTFFKGIGLCPVGKADQ